MVIIGSLIVLGSIVNFFHSRARVSHPISGLIRLAPQHISLAEEIEAGKRIEHCLDVPPDKVPGTLIGDWKSTGSTLKSEDAADDTIPCFTLIGPDFEVIQRHDHAAKGQFNLRITKSGRYKFIFDNRSTQKPSPRQIELRGVYRAD